MKHDNVSRAKRISFIVGAAVICTVATGVVSAGTIKGNVRYAGAPVERKKLSVTIEPRIEPLEFLRRRTLVFIQAV